MVGRGRSLKPAEVGNGNRVRERVNMASQTNISFQVSSEWKTGDLHSPCSYSLFPSDGYVSDATCPLEEIIGRSWLGVGGQSLGTQTVFNKVPEDYRRRNFRIVLSEVYLPNSRSSPEDCSSDDSEKDFGQDLKSPPRESDEIVEEIMSKKRSPNRPGRPAVNVRMASSLISKHLTLSKSSGEAPQKNVGKSGDERKSKVLPTQRLPENSLLINQGASPNNPTSVAQLEPPHSPATICGHSEPDVKPVTNETSQSGSASMPKVSTPPIATSPHMPNQNDPSVFLANLQMQRNLLQQAAIANHHYAQQAMMFKMMSSTAGNQSYQMQQQPPQSFSNQYPQSQLYISHRFQNQNVFSNSPTPNHLQSLQNWSAGYQPQMIQPPNGLQNLQYYSSMTPNAPNNFMTHPLYQPNLRENYATTSDPSMFLPPPGWGIGQ